MATLFVLLFFISIIAWIVWFVKPTIFNANRQISRIQLSLRMAFISLGLLIAFIASLDKAEPPITEGQAPAAVPAPVEEVASEPVEKPVSEAQRKINARKLYLKLVKLLSGDTLIHIQQMAEYITKNPEDFYGIYDRAQTAIETTDYNIKRIKEHLRDSEHNTQEKKAFELYIQGNQKCREYLSAIAKNYDDGVGLKPSEVRAAVKKFESAKNDFYQADAMIDYEIDHLK